MLNRVDSVVKVAPELEVSGKRKLGGPKKTWKKQMEEETEKIGLKTKDGVQTIEEWGESGQPR